MSVSLAQSHNSKQQNIYPLSPRSKHHHEALPGFSWEARHLKHATTPATSQLLRNAFVNMKSSETEAMTTINARVEGGSEHSHHLPIVIYNRLFYPSMR
jgi:hypothetical protein